MSKIVNIQIECPQCEKQYVAKIFRTLWGDGCNADNFETRLKDSTNVVTCPHCGHSFRLPLSLMYVDVQKGFAVWWEPQPDAGIDADSQSYAAMFGADSYYAKAPRVKDWDEFKQTIRRYYTGELKAKPITKYDLGTLKQVVSKAAPSQEKGGCQGAFVLLMVTAASLIGLTCFGLSYLLT